MLKLLSIGVLALGYALASSSVSGSIQDQSNMPVDDAKITIFDAGGKGYQVSSQGGAFALTGIPEGDYFLKAEKDGEQPVIGALRLTDNVTKTLRVVMVRSTGDEVGAGAPMREAAQNIAPHSHPKVKYPQLTKKIQPVYPANERRTGAQGTVRIAMIILPDGSVDDLVVISAPNDRLAMAALAAVRLRRYRPLYIDDQPAETNLTVDVNFQLAGRAN